MAADFDIPPLRDPIAKGSPALMGDTWNNYFSTFYQTIVEFLGQYGIFVPRLTTAQRNEIQTPINGQIIYNTTTNKFQGRENSVWVNLI